MAPGLSFHNKSSLIQEIWDNVTAFFQKRQMFRFPKAAFQWRTRTARCRWRPGLIYLFRFVWIDNCVGAGRSRRLIPIQHSTLQAREGKTIIITIWKASVQAVPHSHTHTHAPASLLLLHAPRQRCPLCSGSPLSLLCGCLCWAMLYLLRCFPEVASVLENLRRPPQRVCQLAAQQRFFQTNNWCCSERLPWHSSHDERQTFAWFATEDLDRVNVLMGEQQRARLSYCEAKLKCKNCTKSLILKPLFRCEQERGGLFFYFLRQAVEGSLWDVTLEVTGFWFSPSPVQD